MTLVYLVFTYFSHLHWPPGPGQDYLFPCPVYCTCAWILLLWPCNASPCSRGWSISGTCQGCIPCCTLIALRWGRYRSLPYSWSVIPEEVMYFQLGIGLLVDLAVLHRIVLPIKIAFLPSCGQGFISILGEGHFFVINQGILRMEFVLCYHKFSQLIGLPA